MNGVALCAGYGGLELGIERFLPGSRTVCYVEGECFAVQHLVKKMEEGSLDAAPIWSNVKTFDGKPWRGKVDWISGGFPCQPYSTAGKQLGEADPRDLWPDFVRIIGEVRPGFLFLENVPNIVKMRLDSIVLDLDQLGYDAAWCVVAASDVGAPHRRRRWFCMAVLRNSNSDGCGRMDKNKASSQRIVSPRKMEGDQFENFGNNDSNSKCCRRDENEQCSPEREFDIERVRGEMAHADDQRMGPCKSRTNRSSDQEGGEGGLDNRGSRKNVESKGYKEPSNLQANVPNSGGIGSNKIGQIQTGNKKSSPEIIGCCCQSKFSNTCGEGLEGALSEKERRRASRSCGEMEKRWGGGFEEQWKVEPSMGRLVDGATDWVDKLRILGNGVVPQQAAYAFQILGDRLAAGIVEKRTPKD